MRPVAELRIRARFVHTPYRHWGAHSGYPKFIEHLDPARYRAEVHRAADNHEEIPLCLRPFRPWLRERLKRRAMKWYKVSDLNAELAAFGRCLAGRLDMVHFLDGEHSVQFLPRALDALGSRVLTVASFHQPPDLLEELLDPAALRGLDHVVLMSPSQISYFERHLPAAKVSVILHGVDADFFHPAPRRPRRSAPRCITVGHWLRDWSVVHAVADRLPGVEFHVVSPRETGLGGLANVILHPSVDDETLAELYRQADLLFLPLLDSTANNSLLEGLASGLPTVTSDLAAVRAYVGGDEAILAPVSDASAAAAAVTRVLNDPLLHARMSAAARARAETLAWRRVAARHEALYTRLVEHARLRAPLRTSVREPRRIEL